MRQTTQAARDKFQADKITNRETRKAATAKKDGLSQKQIDYQKNKRTARDTRRANTNKKLAPKPRGAKTANNDFGIPAGRGTDGATAKGKDGHTRRYDAKTKTWKLVK